mgnify:CR=1 FL=1
MPAVFLDFPLAPSRPTCHTMSMEERAVQTKGIKYVVRASGHWMLADRRKAHLDRRIAHETAELLRRVGYTQVTVTAEPTE